MVGWGGLVLRHKGEERMKPLSETTARTTIGMMRSIASHKPISPFHLMAADEMERLLNEVIEYRKQNESKNKPKKNLEKT
jgi:hypothetical protein